MDAKTKEPIPLPSNFVFGLYGWQPKPKPIKKRSQIPNWDKKRIRKIAHRIASIERLLSKGNTQEAKSRFSRINARLFDISYIPKSIKDRFYSLSKIVLERRERRLDPADVTVVPQSTDPACMSFPSRETGNLNNTIRDSARNRQASQQGNGSPMSSPLNGPERSGEAQLKVPLAHHSEALAG